MNESFIAKARALVEPAAARADPFDSARAYTPGNGRGYAQTALDEECNAVANARPTTRNHTLNAAAFSLGQLVAGGELDEHLVVRELTAAAELCGLDRDAGCGPAGIAATITSGLRAGRLSPRTVPPRDLTMMSIHQLAEEVRLPAPAAEGEPETTAVDEPTTPSGISELTARLVEAERARRDARRILDAEEHASMSSWPNRSTDGASFTLDLPPETPAVWGAGEEVLWAQGESLIIAGGQGCGKTTLAGQLVMARLGLIDKVLGFPVVAGRKRLLYLAMDRPQQAARSLARIARPEWRATLADRLVVWQGPPPFDFAARPETLTEMCQRYDADSVVVDSLKDGSVGISKDEVGAGYNRARQLAIGEGIEVLELHHQVKTSQGGGKPTGINDVYGSVWITSGAGSVLLLIGEPGDPLVEMRHLKQPAEMVGPLDVRHDHTAGTSSVVSGVDLVDLARHQSRGLIARAAASAMFGGGDPSKAQIEKARRRLDRLAREGALVAVEGGGPGGSTAFYAAAR